MSLLPPLEAGRQVAALFARSAPRLFDDLAAADAVPHEGDARERGRAEWECFALFACVRGIVAASGFAPQTAETIDALHEAVFTTWEPAAHAGESAETRRALVARRYGEYETIAQTGGAAGAASAHARLGAAAAALIAGARPTAAAQLLEGTRLATDRTAGAHPAAAAERTARSRPAAAELAELLGSLHESLAEAVVELLSGEGVLADPGAPLGPAAGVASLAGIAAPPLEGAWRIVERLERAGAACGLGGSGLLASLGLAREVRDWDLTTDAPRDRVEAALAGLAWEHKGSDELHADEKFMFPDLDLEVIRGFSFFTPAGVVRVPTIVTRRWAGLPIGSPECWAVAYHLLGREAKRDALLGWLAREGADPAALAALLAQPLAPELAQALRALPVRSA